MSFQSLQMAMSLNETKSRRYADYYRAKRTLRNTSIMAPPEMRDDYFTSVPFCRLACQVLSERIEMDTITAKDEAGKENADASKWLRKILKALGGADFVNSAHLLAMEYGRSYLIPTGTDRPDGLPGVQLVPGRHMVHAVDPYTGEITEALRAYGPAGTLRAYYRPEATYYLAPGEGPNLASNGNGDVQGYVVTNKIETVDGRIAVFPLICRGEVVNSWGRPETKDAFKLQDAACRTATDLSIASATLATPQRMLIGAEEEDFQPRDENGDPLTDANGNVLPGPTAEQLYMARLLTISDPAAKIAEFSAAQLQNFTTALNSLTRQAAAVLGIPQSVFGVASDANPASGDAQRQDDARMIRRAEQLTRGFEPGWVGLFEYLAELANFDVTVVIKWVDPSLPNLASRADAVLKLATVKTSDGRPLYNWRELREMLGDSAEDIDAANEWWETEGIKNMLQNPPPADNGNGQTP